MTAGGTVYLVGAGPGDPGLLTCRGAEVLARAEVVVYDGLVGAGLLELAGPDCERLYAGKKHTEQAPGGVPLTQEEINRLLVERARAGRRVVRLKGGDPFVFGRGAEECEALAAAGVPFEIVPGVSAATAVPAYAGIPLTERRRASTVAFATGHEAAGKPESDVDWEALARAGTVVLFMALRTAGECARHLLAAGRAPETPAAALYWGTTAAQRTVVSTLGELGGAVREAGLRPPVLLVVGDVVGLRDRLAWFERRPLFGARVLVSRGRAQAEPFQRAVAELGGEPILCPVTRIEPCAEPEAARRALEALGSYDWVVFTSANAVRRFFGELDARRLDARAFGGVRLAAVGRATARALGERGLLADVVPDHGDARGLAEAVVAAAGGSLAGRRVLLPRAAAGREEGPRALEEAGAEVEVLPIYRTAAAPADDPDLQHGLRRLRERAVDALALFAPSQVRALWDLLGEEAAEVVGACRAVAAVGPTTARAVESRGVRVDVVASAPDAEVLASEIAEFLGRDPSRDPSKEE